MPEVQDQYKIGPEVIEVNDPPSQQEEAYRLDQFYPSSNENSGLQSN